MIANLNISRKTYWLGGTGVVVLLSIIWYVLELRKNKAIADNIMKAADGTSDSLSPGGATYGDSRDLGISQIIDPAFWRTNPSKVTIWAGNADGTPGPAMVFAKQIYDANASVFSLLDKPGSVVSAFRSLKSKEDVSKLSDVFTGMYKTDLYTYLTNGDWLSNGCAPADDKCHLGLNTNYLKQIYEIILNLN